MTGVLATAALLGGALGVQTAIAKSNKFFKAKANRGNPGPTTVTGTTSDGKPVLCFAQIFPSISLGNTPSMATAVVNAANGDPSVSAANGSHAQTFVANSQVEAQCHGAAAFGTAPTATGSEFPSGAAACAVGGSGSQMTIGPNGSWASGSSPTAAGGAGAAAGARATRGGTCDATGTPGPFGVATTATVTVTGAVGPSGCIDMIPTPPLNAATCTAGWSYSGATATGTTSFTPVFGSPTLAAFIIELCSQLPAGSTVTLVPTPGGLAIRLCGPMPVSCAFAGWNPPTGFVRVRRGPGAS